ncbi:hypothetical protein V2G26_016462 [Clonostachys chloroleuca]
MPRRRVRRGSVEVGKDTRVGILIRREGEDIGLLGEWKGEKRQCLSRRAEDDRDKIRYTQVRTKMRYTMLCSSRTY